jgi:hypothetical protein
VPRELTKGKISSPKAYSTKSVEGYRSMSSTFMTPVIVLSLLIPFLREAEPIFSRPAYAGREKIGSASHSMGISP